VKRTCLVILVTVLVVALSSCEGNVPLEDLTISLILGIDLDEENNLIISESSPVFNKDAKKKIETLQTKAKSIRESRKYFDAMSTGKVTSAKIQVLLIGKRVIEHEDWFSILDTVYRNPNFSINTKVIVVDGPVSDVIFSEPEDKPRLPLYLNRIIEENINRTRTVIANLQVLHRQMYEKGMTPTIPEVKMDKDIKFVGVSLLDEKGKYVDTLTIQESSLLVVLKDEVKEELTLSFPLTSMKDEDGIFQRNQVSFDVTRAKSKIKTNYNQDKFHFDFKIDLTVNIVEQLFPEDHLHDDELEKMIEKELQTDLEGIVSKIQQHQIDPIGLGLFARAYHYEQYKKGKEHWGKVIADSDIPISVNVDINAKGAVK
jgi:Ger(x)C family germination protein